MNDTQHCECGCGAIVTPGCRFRRGHHTRTKEYRGRLNASRVRSARDRRVQMEKDLAGGVGGGLVQMALKSARWDDEWALAGDQALRDTAAVLETIGRYGHVEVSYDLPADEEDPLLVLDRQIEITIEKRHADRLRKEFEKAGFRDLSTDEVKYLYLNYGCVEDFVA